MLHGIGFESGSLMQLSSPVTALRGPKCHAPSTTDHPLKQPQALLLCSSSTDLLQRRRCGRRSARAPCCSITQALRWFRSSHDQLQPRRRGRRSVCAPRCSIRRPRPAEHAQSAADGTCWESQEGSSPGGLHVTIRQAGSSAELRAAAQLRAATFYSYPLDRSEFSARVSI